MMATLAVHDKKAGDEVFCDYLVRVADESKDERHNVKKGVNWALRQIGKRNSKLSKEAIKLAGEIQKINSKAAKWVAKDALRELQSPEVKKRLRK
jgi:3-methyladenine DNA glycosylase AlkD